ncbi:hypothetical protein BU14_0835s0006 [Porphyra umbilicalis]|uniref:Uncharacterized protein n=1 Tax=Porphyra umbilicalis TaxID=2786 RepID=A0A1X6NPG6_PORUM|nr:hypothetical protein BU14_0835s0006 [Porphyra umbilicalis]|eukprot:OSX70243.1 hypothetical protein BU14_0835s0006 [Porphyra umbilicalis]
MVLSAVESGRQLRRSPVSIPRRTTVFFSLCPRQRPSDRLVPSPACFAWARLPRGRTRPSPRIPRLRISSSALPPALPFPPPPRPRGRPPPPCAV